MAASSLLERIRRPEVASARGAVSEAQVRDAILQNLRALCSTLQGTVPASPEYGILCVSELVHSFPDAAGMVARSLKVAIQAYEPRLTNVRVRHIPSDDMVLRFEISGQLAGSGRTPMQFQTTIDTTRRLSVR